MPCSASSRAYMQMCAETTMRRKAIRKMIADERAADAKKKKYDPEVMQAIKNLDRRKAEIAARLKKEAEDDES